MLKYNYFRVGRAKNEINTKVQRLKGKKTEICSFFYGKHYCLFVLYG